MLTSLFGNKEIDKRIYSVIACKLEGAAMKFFVAFGVCPEREDFFLPRAMKVMPQRDPL